jgi:hypothetical protein
LNILENADANVVVVKDLNAPEHYLLRYEEGQKIDDTKPIGMGTAPSDLKVIPYAVGVEE